MISTTKVALGITTMLGAALLSGCSDDEPQWVRQCVQRATDIRVDDDKCLHEDDPRTAVHPYHWYYHHSGVAGVPVGSKVSGGSYTEPDDVSAFGTVPKSGGFGGFKGSSGT